jgi:nucleotide-binding universal stress UspA family protein
MTRTFIAAYDGSPAARAAVDCAIELARLEDAEVLAVHAGPAEQAAALLGELDPRLERRVLAEGAPVATLARLARDERAALLAMGTTHRGRFGRVVPGSVPAGLLQGGAPCPVLVAPAGRSLGALGTIAVAWDEGAQAERALEEAARLARAAAARLVLVAAHEPVAYAGPAVLGARDLETLVRGDLEERAERRAAQVEGVATEALVVRGGAGRAIAAVAEGADLLVTGSRGHGALRSVVTGSVSRHLVDAAGCPVLVVPRSRRAAGEPRFDAMTAAATGWP